MKRTALVVENDGATRRLLDVLLTRAGFETDLCETGRDAMVLLQAVDYSVVVLDLRLPAHSGMEILTTLRDTRPDRIERVIVVSSASIAEIRRVREEFGVAVLRKPFDVGEVLAMVAERAAEPRLQDVGETFCRRSVRAGAKSGVLFQLRGGSLEPAAIFGFDREWAEQFFPVPVGEAYPICHTVRGAEAQWFSSIGSARVAFPTLLPLWTVNDSRSLVTVPLLRGKAVLGGAGWTFRNERAFSDAEQRSLLAIADLVAERLPEAAAQTAP